jgi:hypothetical protein
MPNLNTDPALLSEQRLVVANLDQAIPTPAHPPPITATGDAGQVLVDLDNPSSHLLLRELARGYLPSLIAAYNAPHSANRVYKVNSIVNAATKDIFKMFVFTPRLAVAPSFENLRV